MSEDDLALLGPLAPLVGTWEGDKGKDSSPSDDGGPEDRSVGTNVYRERVEFEPTGLVDNHAQNLYGLRYRTTAWRLGADASFHEELGFWMWDAEAGQVMRGFVVPRGITTFAGGDVSPDATAFTLEARVGDGTFGICSNPFLDREFRTIRYVVEIEILADGWSYWEDTQMQLADGSLFHHTDENRLRRAP